MRNSIIILVLSFLSICDVFGELRMKDMYDEKSQDAAYDAPKLSFVGYWTLVYNEEPVGDYFTSSRQLYQPDPGIFMIFKSDGSGVKKVYEFLSEYYGNGIIEKNYPFTWEKVKQEMSITFDNYSVKYDWHQGKTISNRVKDEYLQKIENWKRSKKSGNRFQTRIYKILCIDNKKLVLNLKERTEECGYVYGAMSEDDMKQFSDLLNKHLSKTKAEEKAKAEAEAKAKAEAEAEAKAKAKAEAEAKAKAKVEAEAKAKKAEEIRKKETEATIANSRRLNTSNYIGDYYLVEDYYANPSSTGFNVLQYKRDDEILRDEYLWYFVKESGKWYICNKKYEFKMPLDEPWSNNNKPILFYSNPHKYHIATPTLVGNNSQLEAARVQ